MIETALIDLPQFNVYHHSLQPIAHYYHEHSKAPLADKDIDKLLPYARQTDFISNLNPVIKSHKELLKVSDNILSNLIQAQNDLGIVISQHERKRV